MTSRTQRENVAARPPLLLRLRTSTAFITFAVALGILTDLSCYGLIVPVIPFRLEALKHTSVSAKTGWLVAAYNGGLIVFSPLVGWLGEVVKGRRRLLIFFLLFMAGGLVLFMEASSLTAMIISRIMLGISGSGMWTLGLALLSDSVSEQRLGIVMGYAMIGSSAGSASGPPIGGALYEKLGFRAPFVFGLVLVTCDMALRLLLVEKQGAIDWIRTGVDIPDFECADPNFQVGHSEDHIISPAETVCSDFSTKKMKPSESVSFSGENSEYGQTRLWPAMVLMVTTARPATLFLMTIINGFVVGGLLDTGMTLWLQHKYNMNSLESGLVFLGVAIPSLFASPFSGWASDKYGPKWVGTGGMLLSVPGFFLLLIECPLALFVFFVVIVGTSQALFLTPVLVDLSNVVATTPGLGSSSVYGGFNMCFSIGSFIGPIVAGQIINAVGIKKGWMIICCACGVVSAAVVPCIIHFVGGPAPWHSKKVVANIATANFPLEEQAYRLQ